MPQDDSEKTSSKPDGEYEVGYGKPPKKSQPKKGQSGNPSGRKKAQKSWLDHYLDVIGETVAVNVGGEPKRMAFLEAMFRAQANRALKSDRGFAQMMALLKEVEPILLEEFQNCGVLVVHPQMPLDEWEKVAFENQRKYREPSYLRDDEEN